jgi:sterol desaturase/sphingolipid hydroxylase (fatty acid hydroxylase superfamily)
MFPDLIPRVSELADALAEELGALFMAAEHRTHWLFLLGALLIAVVIGVRRANWSWRDSARRWCSRSARVDYLLIIAKPVIFTVFALPWTLTAYTVALFVVRVLDQQLGYRVVESLSPFQVSALYSVVLFIAWDLSRFLLHWAMHRVPLLWQFHQVHHSAEVLTPLTLYRAHPVESALSLARGILVTGLLTGVFFHLFRGNAIELELMGINAFGFAFNLLGGNLRHSHVWWSWGPRIERWFISPAQHQIHHARDGVGPERNFGTWLAIWDRLLGSLEPAGSPPRSFGLPDAERNHQPTSVLSALFDPVFAAITRKGTRPPN